MSFFVTVVIPALNEEKYIRRCISAIKISFANSKNNGEIILVDNGSTDATVDIANELGCETVLAPSATISAMRNLGARKGRGEVLAFVDADVIVDEEWLDAGCSCLQAEGIVCAGGFIAIPQDASWVESTWQLSRLARPQRFYVDWVASMNMFVKGDIFWRVGGFNEKLVTCEDVDLCIRLKKYGRILYDKSIVVTHLGEAKDIFSFYRKERWRGQSNFKGLVSHGFSLKEIPSLLMPIIFLPASVLFFLVIFGALKNFYVFLFSVSVLLVPFFRALKTILFIGFWGSYLKLSFLWFVYYFARSVSVLRAWRRV